MKMKSFYLLFFIALLLISGCKPESPSTIPESKFVFTKDGIVAPANVPVVTPTIPTLGPTLILFTTSPLAGTQATPSILVGNVNAGEIVSVYTDSECTVKIGSAIAPAPTVLITTSSLIVGDYKFYGKTLNAFGISSPCSNKPISYTFTGVNPVLATSMVLQNPAPLAITNPIYHEAAPTISLSGVQSGDRVYLYKDASCTNSVGNSLATASTVLVQTTSLTPGTYTFYTKSINSYGINTACSSINLVYKYNYLLDVTLTYDFVPTTTGKWDYANTSQKPLRNVFVEMRKTSDNSLMNTFTTDSSGNFKEFVGNSNSNSFYFNIFAKSISPSIIVQDNTAGKSTYVVKTESYSLNSDYTLVKNLPSGWSGTNSNGSYTSSRIAAPFAILDSIYTVSTLVTTARPSASIPDLKVNWSKFNIAISGDKALGQVASTHYNLNDNEIYVLGYADNNADEYDRHKIVREWGHFFEAKLSRNDSMGGSRVFGDYKDRSVAFSEGFCTALAAMAFAPDVTYVDSSGARQQTTLAKFNVETVSVNEAIATPGLFNNPGWYSETSIAKILYDISDLTNVSESFDNLNMGVGPIYDVMIGNFKYSAAPTSIFSFIYYLKVANPGNASAIDAIVANESIDSVADEYGTGETHNGLYTYNLPTMNLLTLGGPLVRTTIWANTSSLTVNDANSAWSNRYYRFTATTNITSLNLVSDNSVMIKILKKGTLATVVPSGVPNAPLVPAKWTYTTTANVPITANLPSITTIPGQEYIVQVTIDKNIVSTPLIINNIVFDLGGVGL